MATYSQEPSHDNPIKDNLPDTNFATLPSDNLDVGESNAAVQKVRTLIKWDLSSLTGATINSAVLSMYDRATDLTDNARTMFAYRVLRAWTESDSTWNNYSAGNAWGTAGCANTTTDREAANIGVSVSLANPPTAGFKAITLTTAAVQEWIDGTLTNNGVILIMDVESNDMHRFNSRRYPTSSERPKLVIDYTIGGSLVYNPASPTRYRL